MSLIILMSVIGQKPNERNYILLDLACNIRIKVCQILSCLASDIQFDMLSNKFLHAFLTFINRTHVDEFYLTIVYVSICN